MDILYIFLAEKEFEACGGFELDERRKRLIAAQASLLLIGHERPFRIYPHLKVVLVYAGAFTDGEQGVRAGESWHRGHVVLAWDYVCYGSQDEKDGHNVGIHEFAHQLDQEDGSGDGVPFFAVATESFFEKPGLF